MATQAEIIAARNKKIQQDLYGINPITQANEKANIQLNQPFTIAPWINTSNPPESNPQGNQTIIDNAVLSAQLANNPITGSADLLNLANQARQSGNINLANQYTGLANEYDIKTTIPTRTNEIFTRGMNDFIAPSNRQYQNVLSTVDSDYKNRLEWLKGQFDQSFGPQGTQTQLINQLFTDQANNLARQYGNQQNLVEAQTVKSWANPAQVNVALNDLNSKQQEDLVKFQSAQTQQLQNIANQYNNLLTNYLDRYGSSTDKYVVDTAKYLKGITDSFNSQYLESKLKEDQLAFQVQQQQAAQAAQLKALQQSTSGIGITWNIVQTPNPTDPTKTIPVFFGNDWYKYAVDASGAPIRQTATKIGIEDAKLLQSTATK